MAVSPAFHRILCLGFLGAFAAAGIWGHFHVGGFAPLLYRSPMGCTETFLSLALDDSASAPGLVRLLGEVPAGRDILLFLPNQNQTTAMFIQTLNYAVWPRRVIVAQLSGPDREKVFRRTVADARPGALLFYCLNVPSTVLNGAALGPRLVYVRVP